MPVARQSGCRYDRKAMPTKLLPLAAALLLAPLALSQDERPNFLLIIADDVTYNDLPLYGGPNISTPNVTTHASVGVET